MKKKGNSNKNLEIPYIFCQCFDSLKSSSLFEIWDSHRQRIIEMSKNKRNLLENEIMIMERALDFEGKAQKKILDIGCGIKH